MGKCWATIGLLMLAGLAPACVGADEFEGCWQAEAEGRTVSFLALSDAREAIGLEVRTGDVTRETELRGRWDTSGPDRYSVDVSCSRVEQEGGGSCEGVPEWSLSCTLAGEDELRCLGAPFSAETRMGPCPDTGQPQ